MRRRAGRRRPRGEEAEELERRAQRELLARELRLAEASARRLRLAWRQRLAQLGPPAARERLEAARRAFERAADARDFAASLLLDELRAAAEAGRRAGRAHAAALERLLGAQRRQLEARAARHGAGVGRALAEAAARARGLRGEQLGKELLLRALLFATGLRHGGEAEAARTGNLSRLDGLREENDNALRTASVVLARRLRGRSGELARVLREHEENTRERRKDFEKLRRKDDEDQRVIALNAARLEKLYEALRALRAKIAECRLASDKEIADCRFERDYFRAAYFAIQRRLLSVNTLDEDFRDIIWEFAEQAFDRECLKCLTTEHNKAEEFLKQCLRTIERIFSVLNLCSGYETYQDKLLLYPLSIASKTECANDAMKETENDRTQQFFADSYPLLKFVKIVSKVNRDVISLKQSMKYLINESSQLKCSLKLYMNQVTKPHPDDKKENALASPVIIEVKDVLY